MHNLFYWKVESALSTLTLLMMLSLLWSGCDFDDKPDHILPQEKYIKIYAELHLVRKADEMRAGTLNTKNMVQQVYEKYDITPRQFRESLEYYNRNLEDQGDLVKKAIDHLQDEMNQLEEEDKNRNKDTVRTKYPAR